VRVDDLEHHCQLGISGDAILPAPLTQRPGQHGKTAQALQRRNDCRVVDDLVERHLVVLARCIQLALEVAQDPVRPGVGRVDAQDMDMTVGKRTDQIVTRDLRLLTEADLRQATPANAVDLDADTVAVDVLVGVQGCTSPFQRRASQHVRMNEADLVGARHQRRIALRHRRRGGHSGADHGCERWAYDQW